MPAADHGTNPAVALAALAGLMALATLNYLLLTRPADIRAITPPRSPSQTGAAAAAAVRAAPPALAIDRTAILARPLFRPDRRPYVAPPADTAPPVASLEVEIGPVAAPSDPGPELAPAEPALLPPGLRLVGILRDEDRARALLRHDGGPARWYPQGEELSGWTLTRIGPDFVELQALGQTSMLKLFTAPDMTAEAGAAEGEPAN